MISSPKHQIERGGGRMRVRAYAIFKSFSKSKTTKSPFIMVHNYFLSLPTSASRQHTLTRTHNQSPNVQYKLMCVCGALHSLCTHILIILSTGLCRLIFMRIFFITVSLKSFIPCENHMHSNIVYVRFDILNAKNF